MYVRHSAGTLYNTLYPELNTVSPTISISVFCSCLAIVTNIHNTGLFVSSIDWCFCYHTHGECASTIAYSGMGFQILCSHLIIFDYCFKYLCDNLCILINLQENATAGHLICFGVLCIFVTCYDPYIYISSSFMCFLLICYADHHYHHRRSALPALPISIVFGVVFYILTLWVLQPFVMSMIFFHGAYL